MELYWSHHLGETTPSGLEEEYYAEIAVANHSDDPCIWKERSMSAGAAHCKLREAPAGGKEYLKSDNVIGSELTETMW